PGALHLVDLQSPAVAQSWSLARPVWALAGHPDGRRFAVGGELGLMVYDAEHDGHETVGAGNVTATAVSPDGSLVAIGTRKGKVELWSFEGRERVARLESHTDLVTAIA